MTSLLSKPMDGSCVQTEHRDSPDKVENKEKPKGQRTGFSTGACSQAGVAACLVAFLEGAPPQEIAVRLPIGRKAVFPLADFCLDLHSDKDRPSATATIVKDAGDDPDVTHGASIVTSVRLTTAPGVRFFAGEGVGTVTKPGLGLAVGDPAINPVPREMIRNEFLLRQDDLKAWTLKHYGWSDPGMDVTISIPNGEVLAEKTLNGRLGILGGLSILGTKGIVVPFSTSAYRASISQAIDVALARDITTLVFTTGGQSEKFAQKIRSDLPEEAFIQIGDFTGFSLREAVKKNVGRVIMAGFLGKFSKLAAGVTQTHAAGSSVDLEFLSSVAREAGCPDAVCDEIAHANTARHAGEIALAAGCTAFFSFLGKRVCNQLKKTVKNELPIEVLLTNFDGTILSHEGDKT